MASVIRLAYGGGENRKRLAKWYACFKGPRGERLRWAGFESKNATSYLARQLELVASYVGAGEHLPADLRQWIDGAPAEIREKMIAVGMLSAQRAAAAESLDTHMEDWAAHLRAKESTARHVRLMMFRVKRLWSECGFRGLREIQREAAERWVDERHREGALGPATINQYLVAARAFLNYCISVGRLAGNPLDRVPRLNAAKDVRKQRRALTEDELRRLLSATERGPARYGMTGSERATVYLLAAETGLRYSEIQSLTRASFQLDGNPPTVTVRASCTKNGDMACIPLRSAVVARLRNHLASKAPTDHAFKMFDGCGHKMIEADWRLTGDVAASLLPIPYVDEYGRTRDFHALRHSFVSNLARGGVHPVVAQKLARHSKIDLTMNTYTHVEVQDAAKALAALPDLTGRAAENRSAEDATA